MDFEEDEINQVFNDSMDDGFDDDDDNYQDFIDDEDYSLPEEFDPHQQTLINDEYLTKLEIEEDSHGQNPIDWNALDDEFVQFQSTLKQVTGIGGGGDRSKGRPRGTHIKNYPPDVRENIGRANLLYVNRNLEEALRLTHTIIAKNPSISEAWNTLGLIWEDLGNHNKSFQAFLLAAHINPYEPERWKTLAEKSLTKGLYDQALYCISKAVMADPTDLDLIKNKAKLCEDIQDVHRTMISYRQILRVNPSDLETLRKLIDLCSKSDNLSKAVTNMHHTFTCHLQDPVQDGTPESTLTLSDLNIMVELYLLDNRYLDAVRRLIRGYEVVCLNKRTDTWVEDHITLSMIEDTARPLLHASDVQFPMDLKTKMGTLLIFLNLTNLGQQFHNQLYHSENTHYHDLYIQIATDFQERQRYDIELEQYQRLIMNFPHLESHILWNSMAKCYENLENYERSIYYYCKVEEVGEADKETLKTMMTLYEKLGDSQAAFHMADKLVKFNKKSQAQDLDYLDDAHLDDDIPDLDDDDGSEYEPPEGDRDNEAEDEEDTYVFKREKIKKVGNNKKQRKTKKRNVYATHSIVHNIDISFHKLKLLFPESENYRAAFNETVFQLSQLFTTKQEFFYQREPNQTVKDDYEIPSSEIDSKMCHIPTEFAADLKDLTFHGYPLEQWYQLFLVAGVHMYQTQEGLKANHLFRNIADCFMTNKFPQFQIYLKLLNLTLAYQHGDFHSMAEYLRHWIQGNVSDRRVYGFYSSALSAGFRALSHFGNPSVFKYFTRLLIENERKLKSGEIDAQSELPGEVYFIQGLMLLCGRSYLTAIHYFHQASLKIPDEPIIQMCIGLCYLMISTARNSDNRHYQVLQAFAYLKQYYQARVKEQGQEAAFNLARAFHYIGLFHLAIPHYEKVLELYENQVEKGDDYNLDQDTILPHFNLKFEAAYNLSMYYRGIGSTGLAQYYLWKYCTI